MSGKEKPASLERRVKRFFTENPHEELSVNDMMAKFDCTESAASQAVSRLRRSGVPIASIVVYRLGPVKE